MGLNLQASVFKSIWPAGYVYVLPAPTHQK